MSRTLSNEENLNLGSDLMSHKLCVSFVVVAISISNPKMKSLIISILIAGALAEFFEGCP